MIFRAFAHCRLAVLAFALTVGAPSAIVGVCAQQTAPTTPGASQAAPATPASPAPAATPPAASAPVPNPSPAPAAGAPSGQPSASPAAPPPGPNGPAATPPATATPAAPAAPLTSPLGGAAAPDAGNSSDDSSSGQSLQMVARPAAYIEGKANWSEGFSALMGAFSQITAELTKSGLAASGRPITVFTATDDTGFSYRAMIPIEKSPEGKTGLSDAVKLGQTPAGKAMKFEHRGSYEDIDSTYEAITAYLDEKGLEADNLFVEEYLNEVKAPDDPNLQVDIYVLLK
jgi:effector-binding domain-containing protein